MRSSQAAALVSDALDAVLDDPEVLGVTSYYDTNLDTLVSRDGPHRARAAEPGAATSGQGRQRSGASSPLLRAAGPGLEVEIGGSVAAATLAQEIARGGRAQGRVDRAADRGAAHAHLLPERGGGAAARADRRPLRRLRPSALVGLVGSNFVEIAIFALNVCAFLGLGLSIDYALLMVQRFREELGAGRPVRDAVVVTLDTAGRAVWVSGIDRGGEPRRADLGAGAAAAQRRARRRARRG